MSEWEDAREGTVFPWAVLRTARMGWESKQ